MATDPELSFTTMEIHMTRRTTSAPTAERLLRHGRQWLLGAAVALTALSALAEPVEGEVKKVDAATGTVTLKHGVIQSLDMPAMQKVYRVSNPEWLKNLQVGDKVIFSADKVNGYFTVTAIEPKK